MRWKGESAGAGDSFVKVLCLESERCRTRFVIRGGQHRREVIVKTAYC